MLLWLQHFFMFHRSKYLQVWGNTKIWKPSRFFCPSPQYPKSEIEKRIGKRAVIVFRGLFLFLFWTSKKEKKTSWRNKYIGRWNLTVGLHLDLPNAVYSVLSLSFSWKKESNPDSYQPFIGIVYFSIILIFTIEISNIIIKYLNKMWQPFETSNVIIQQRFPFHTFILL